MTIETTLLMATVFFYYFGNYKIEFKIIIYADLANQRLSESVTHSVLKICST